LTRTGWECNCSGSSDPL
ncbi:matrix protein 2, partial [Influenza A virus (A/chicken/Shanghai/Y1/2006(H9N2))]